MDDTDRRVLDALQADLPLVGRPYAVVGERLGLAEDQVLERVRQLKEAGIVRQVGPIFDSRRLGYHSTLCAFAVRPDHLDEVAHAVSAHTGVSHNYSRVHSYNLWFTLTLPAGRSTDDEVAHLARDTGVADYLTLPALRRFKIGVRFDLTGDPGDGGGPSEAVDQDWAPLTALDRRVVREAQDDVPVTPRPFLPAATRLGLTEEALLLALRDLHERRVMRRFCAVLRHRRIGYTANGMGCWVVPEERIEEAGLAAAGVAEVSHCYHRPAYPPRWPYNLFTMLHGRHQSQVQETATRLSLAMGVREYALLFSDREYKKERVRYFEEG